MLSLYWAPQTRSITALWLMEEAGIPYERVLVDIRSGAQSTPEYRAVNPMAKVPALKDGEATIAETGALCAYVCERHPEAGLAPPLDDHARRAKFLYWLFFYPGCVEPAILQTVTKLEIASSSAGWGDADRVFDVLDKAVSQRQWLLGDQFTAADVVIGSAINFVTRIFKIVPSRPTFDAYVDRCIARPAFQRALAIERAG